MGKDKVFTIISPPSELTEKDRILAKSYKDIIYIGRAFLHNDILNKILIQTWYKSNQFKLINNYLK